MADTPYPSAVEFISKWDYHNATADQVEKLEEQARDFPRQAEWTEDDLRAAFKHLHTAVCTPSFPVYDTGPASLAKAALDFLLNQTGKNEAFYGDYTAFILGCIASGPNLAQIDMMSKVLSRGGMKSCFQAMSGQQLYDFLQGLKKQFVNNETFPKDYCSKLSSVLRTHIIQDFKPEQAAEYRVWFVELLMYYQSLVPKSEEHMATLYYTQLGSAIEHLFRRDKWRQFEEKVPDPAPLLFKEQIKSICDVVKSGKFPAYEKQAHIFKSCLWNIFEMIRENKAYLSTYLDDVMQCLPVFAKLPFSDVQEKLMEPHSTFFSRMRDCKDLVKNKPELFERYAPLVTNLILDIPHSKCLGKQVKDILEYLLAESAGNSSNPAHMKIWTKFMAALVSQPDVRYVEACERFMRNNKKIFRWKDYAEGAHLMLTTIAGVKFYPKEEGKGRIDDLDAEKVGRKLADATEELLKQLKNSKLIGEFQADILSITQQFLENGDQNTFSIAKECCEFVELKDDLSLALPAIQTYAKQFKNEDYPWKHWALVGVTMDLLIHVIQGHKDPEQFKPYEPYYVSIFKTAMSRDYWDYESGSKNIFGYVLIGPLVCFGALYRTAKDHSNFQPLLGDTVRMLTCDDEDIAKGMSSLFMLVSVSNPGLFAPYLKEILQALFNTNNTSLLSVIKGAYKANPSPVDEEFQRVFDLLDSLPANDKSHVLILLNEIAGNKPQLFTKENIAALFDDYIDNPIIGSSVLQLLQSVSQKTPEKLEPHMDKLYQQLESLLGASMVPVILVNIVSKNEKLTIPVFNKLINYVKTCSGDYSYLAGALNAIRVLGSRDRELLKPHKELFKKIGEKHPNLKEMCKMLVDIIEGRSVEDITDKIEQQQGNIEQLDVRVTSTENEVTEIGQEVDKQGQNIGQLRQDVDKQDVRVDGLEVKVDETSIKVEEIDNKTLSNAPAWSRDVSKLLNPEAEHDWRLLAQRLSYSPEDIRGWATQHDPCMSLLSEWFATHKTSEATKAVLKILEEMNRLDAAEIVGRAMKAVENVVQDEPPDYENPPPVFISYQWGHQQEVRILRKHLEMAGFESWMDIGQMGGGDKLYAKIDEGIRAAKAVICCVTEKYAKSPNCNREVNLAVNLGKPIIPLLLENVAWPPPGAMGPIFGEYLYIRFFQRDSAIDSKDERVWPPLSFQELLMQLSYMKLIPEHSKIKKPYVNWWLPPEEVIVVKKKSTGGKEVKTIAKSDEKQDEGSKPEVFISYQWGHQPDVKALYKRMCSLGYHCWMDIHQMGGGDSLYDKIDQGVRGCKVVISCVTDKYSKSANCRREVSLADALKKPIIPLLFEETTWPPSGPMSMVFTQLLYIDFKDDKVRSSWNGPQFDELLHKIKIYLPDDNGSPSGDNKNKEPTKTTQPANGQNTGNTNGNKEKEPVKKAQSPTLQDNREESKKVSESMPVAKAPTTTAPPPSRAPPPSSAPPASTSPSRPNSSQQRRSSRPFTPKKDTRSKSCLIL